MSTTACQVDSSSIWPSQNSVYISTTTLFQWERANGPVPAISISVSISVSASFTVSISASVVNPDPVTNAIATYAFCASHIHC